MSADKTVTGTENMSPEDNKKSEVSTFRRILPQVLASSAKNFLLLDLGMSIAFPTIVIPALRGLKNRDENEFLWLTDVQASWFGKTGSSLLDFLINKRNLYSKCCIHLPTCW